MLATDVAVTSFTSDDTDWVVQYDVANEDAAAFDIGVYRSSDGVTPDALLVTYSVSNAADRTVGVGHSLTISADFLDVEQDYFLIAQVDSGGVLAETDETNNQTLFGGGLFLESDGTLQFHGNSGADTLGVLWDQVVPDTLEVSWNTVLRNYAVSAVSTIHVRTHGGADTLTVDPDANLTIWAFGGDGADYLQGGSYDDKLYGGGGNDSLFGGDPSFGYGGSGGSDYL